MTGEVVDEFDGSPEESDTPDPMAAYREVECWDAVALLPDVIHDGRWEQLEKIGWALIGWSRAKRGGRWDDE
jgi:hypothetical protein